MAFHRAHKAHEFLEVPACDHDMTAEACRRVVFEAFGAFLKRWLHMGEAGALSTTLDVSSIRPD